MSNRMAGQNEKKFLLLTDNLRELLDALTVGLARERGPRREEAREDILRTVHQSINALRFLGIVENSE